MDSNSPAIRRIWRRRVRRFWRDWFRPLLIVTILVLSFRSAIADWNDVPTGSMVPTILEGDRIFVNKLAYDLKVPFTTLRLAKWSVPKRGDVVVFISPVDGERWVKRVVGVPGDRIELRDNRLYVNGVAADYEALEKKTVRDLDSLRRVSHNFANEKVGGEIHPIMVTPGSTSRRSFTEIVVPEGHLFVMGDNRDNSMDSRWFGCLDMNRVLGEATAVALSVDPERHYRPRWDRFFHALP